MVQLAQALRPEDRISIASIGPAGGAVSPIKPVSSGFDGGCGYI